MKYKELFYRICEKVKNDPAGVITWEMHFCNEVEAFVNAETKSWRDAHELALKNIGVMGARLEKALKKGKA